MNDIAEERPSFYEGEYLSASDLQQLVVYLRDQNSRHLVGAHTWGIVSGLQLLEQTAPSGGTDVYVLPGYAVDGFGRAITVINPLQLDVSWFTGQPTGPVEVWIRYDQGQTSAQQPGFQVCCNTGDTYSRTAESYAIEVGDLSLANQQSGITVGGEAVADARTAPRTFDDNGLVVCDSSIPYQGLPLADDTQSYWLIPLGWVNWQNGTPGNFVTMGDATDPAKLIYSRRLRRYAGVVAESVFAADGLIRLRRRETGVAGTVTQAVVDAACGLGDLTDPSHDDDLQYCADGPVTNELVWIEGRTRATDDVRILAPARLEMRDSSGTDYYPTSNLGSTPLFFQRTDTPSASGTTSNADLALAIGKSATTGVNNRFLVQQVTGPAAPTGCAAVQFATPATTLLSVLDNGNVGIGTGAPDQLLEIANSSTTGTGNAFIHMQDVNAPSDLYVGASTDGGVLATLNTNDLRIRTGGTDPTDDTHTQVIVLSTGQVGIGTTTPNTNNVLTLQAKGQASMLMRTANDKHEGLLVTNKNGTLLCANTKKDPLILSANGNQNGMMWIASTGNVGIGTDDPDHKLGVEDPIAAEISLRKTGGADLVAGADATGTMVGSTTNDQLAILTNNTTRMTITAGGSVGIGTTTPSQTLDVNGKIALGTTQKYLAPGGIQQFWVIMPGTVNNDGSTAAGQGFTSSITGPGVYNVIFNTPFPTNTIPVVTLQLTGAFTNDIAIPLITGVNNTGFSVALWTIGATIFGFSFVAMIPGA